MTTRIVFDNTPEARRNVEQAVKVALTTAALMVMKPAKDGCAVDTGNLKGSISYSVSGGPVTGVESPANAEDGVVMSKDNQATIGTSVSYAYYLEQGTSRSAAQPFLLPALKRNEAAIKKKMGEIIGAAVKAAGR